MHDLEALLYRLQNSGLSEPQAEQSMQLIQQYVAEKYPVMGMLLHGWLKQNFNNLSHPAKNVAETNYSIASVGGHREL